MKETTRAKLLDLFPYRDLLGPEEFAFEEDEEIQEIDLDTNLADSLPAHRFFKTRLMTSYEEYPFVEVIVAIRTDNQDDVRTLIAPSYRPESPDFFELFYGLHAPKGNERQHITRAIGRLLESLTHEGSLEEMETKEGSSTLNLFSGDVSQNVLLFEFDDSDRLVAIRVGKGSGRK